MNTFVALLRGINVGGNNKLPMADLRALCSGLGWEAVQTYIASGNVVFRADGAETTLAEALKSALPFDVSVMVREARELEACLRDCPISPEKGNLLHGFFCTHEPTLNMDLIDQFRTDEDVVTVGRTVWLHTPGGFSKSKLAERFEKAISGTTVTARNLNTISKLVDMSFQSR